VGSDASKVRLETNHTFSTCLFHNASGLGPLAGWNAPSVPVRMAAGAPERWQRWRTSSRIARCAACCRAPSLADADTVTVTKNEILYSLNKPDDFILAMVAFGADGSHEVRYLRRPFQEKGVTTDFAGATVNFPFARLLSEATSPS
jgi:hypothetical protein